LIEVLALMRDQHLIAVIKDRDKDKVYLRRQNRSEEITFQEAGLLIKGLKTQA